MCDISTKWYAFSVLHALEVLVFQPYLGQGLGSTRTIVSEKSSIAEEKPVSVCLLIKATDTDI